MAFTNKIPDWKNEGVEPSEELKTNGFQHGYKPPAGIFNWFWNKVSKCIKEIQEKIVEPNEKGAIPIESGGTGATTAEEALKNLGGLPTTGGTLVGDLSARTFVQLQNAYGTPVEIGQYLDMHKYGSTEDFDLRIFVDDDGSPKIAIKGKGEHKLYGEHNKPTANDVGALPINGSEAMTSDLHIHKDEYVQIFMKETNSNSHARLQLNGGGLMIDSAPNADDMDNRRYIMLYSDSNTPLSAAVRLVDVVNGAKLWHTLYGTHNKPTGTYTGNGHSSERIIETGGIGNALLVWTDGYTGTQYTTIVTPNYTIPQDGASAKFANGKFTILSNSARVNANGVVYNYQVL